MVVDVNIPARDGQCGQHLLELTASPWVKERTSIPLILVGGLWYSPHLATAHHAEDKLERDHRSKPSIMSLVRPGSRAPFCRAWLEQST